MTLTQRLVLGVCFGTAIAACNTDRSGAAPESFGGTTIDNGRLVPIGVVIQYGTAAAAGDAATTAAVEALVAGAQAKGSVTDQRSAPLGAAGGRLLCVQFAGFSQATDFRRQLCGVIAAGNARAGATLTKHAQTLKCAPESVLRELAADQGCD